MEDIVERLRGVGYDYDFHENSLIHAAVEEIESLRAQLVVAKAEIAREERRFSDLWEQLLATQAHAARLVEALEMYAVAYNKYWVRGMDILEPTADSALSTPINLDALHEDRAQTLDGAAEIVSFISPDSSCQRAAERLGRIAAEYRAKKEK